jgi:type IV pilus assembly protein PilM
MSGEKYCGACGADLIGGIEKRIQEYRQRFQDAARLGAECRFDEAIALLAPVSRAAGSRFTEIARQATAVIERLAQQRDHRLAEAERTLQAARHCLSIYDYDGAVGKLQQIPAALRNNGASHLLDEASSKAREVASLGGELREAIRQKRNDELLPKVSRLLSLKPDHPQAQRLAEQFRRRLCEAAKQKLVQHRYDAALGFLEQIPGPARNEEVETLREQAAELAWLWGNLQNAPVIDKTLLHMGERLLRLSPGDPRLQKLLTELKRRTAQAASDPFCAVIPWATPPHETYIGYPVEWVTGFQRIRYADGFDPSLFVEHPGCYFAAAGLALQGLGEAAVNISLVPEERSVLGRVGQLMRKRPARSAWGLDLSSAGLKAVRLALDSRNGQVLIEACDYVEHRKPLNHAVNEEEERALVEETLRTFAGRNDVKADRTCLGLPSRLVLTRQFTLPVMDSAKLPAAVQFEAKRNVPFPLDDLVWDYEALDRRFSGAAGRGAEQIVLAAVKRVQLDDRLAWFRNAGFKVDVVQCDGLALANFFACEYFAGEENAGASGFGPGAVIAILDVGSDATNVVIVGPGTIWLSGAGVAGQSFTRSLVQQFQLTFAQAEELKRDFTLAPSLSGVQKAIAPVFEDLVSELRRALASFHKKYAPLKVDRVLAIGGGFQVHGLLHYLRLGTA